MKVEELSMAIDRLAALLPAVDPERVETGDLGPALVRLSALRDRLDAARHRLTAEQARRTAWQADGAGSHKQWLRDHCHLSAGEAAGQVLKARQLTELPATAAALADGTIGGAHAQVAAHAARDLPEEALVGLDALVAGEGAGMDAAALRVAVDDYTHRAAPDALEERERRAWRARRLQLTSTADGAAVVDGRLDPVARRPSSAPSPHCPHPAAPGTHGPRSSAAPTPSPVPTALWSSWRCHHDVHDRTRRLTRDARGRWTLQAARAP